ncbi:MAG: glucokinase [Neisseria sp.]|nr:glucokinase [Neisseria sp.]
MIDSYPRLIADIGGTNARFALETAEQVFEKIDVLACQDYPTVVDAIREYLRRVGVANIQHAGIAIANPIVGDWVQMTNHHWAFSIEETRQVLGFNTLILINDFTAQALAVSQMANEDLVQVKDGVALSNLPKAVLGAGTGLGVSGLIPNGRGGFSALAGEGGHVSFAPMNELETQIWQYAKQQFAHVSAERFLSGMGLSLIYEALSFLQTGEATQLSPAQITEAAFEQNDERALQTLDVFCAMLGTVAADLTLTLGARGGVYLCGGIVPRFLDYFKKSAFSQRFTEKGRFSAYLNEIAVFVVLADFPGISGAAVGLNNELLLKGIQ